MNKYLPIKLISFNWNNRLLVGVVDRGQLGVTELQETLDALQMIGPVILVRDVIVDRATQKLISEMNFVITNCF